LLRSIDNPRRRPAPPAFELVDDTGTPTRVVPNGPTLIVAVKDNCVGCSNFYSSRHPGFATYDVYVIATDDVPIANSAYPIYRAPELLAALEIRSAPFYVLVDGVPPFVEQEGLVFDVEQVLAELR